VGRYVASLLSALLTVEDPASGPRARPHEILAGAFTLRGRSSLPGVLPPGVTAVGPPLPARAMQRLWQRLPVPTLTQLMGRLDVFHATNFVLPPPGRAAGVVTVHDLSFLRTPHTVSAASEAYRELVPRSLSRAAVVVTPSQAVADEVIETYGVSPDRLAVTPLGVGEEWFATSRPDPAARQRLGLPERYLLFVGALEPRKNLPVLMDAYRLLLRSDRDAPPLVLLGPRGWGPALTTGDIPEGKVLFPGYREDDDLRATVAGAEALVYPSAYEGFGLPPLEAFACGVPVIASDLPVIEEVVGPDRALAQRVPAGDAEALAEALTRRLSTPDPAGADDARRQRARRFTWAATAEATLCAYHRAVA
jgi:glycosyltransferase involved in cell wall biosynthesis